MSQQVLDRPTIDYTKPIDKEFPSLTGFDRCDAPTVRYVNGVKARGRCGAQAFVRVVLPSGRDLTFCGHCIGEPNDGKAAPHSKEAHVHLSNREVLKKMGARFISEYHTINIKPTESSEAKGF